MHQYLEELFAAGFRGRMVFDNLGPHPQAQDYLERAAEARLHPPTDCQICAAILGMQEKLGGFSLLEFRHAGLAGCDACSALYRSVDHFARLLVGEYEPCDTLVTQKSTQDCRLLEEANNTVVEVHADGQESCTFSLMVEGRWKRLASLLP